MAHAAYLRLKRGWCRIGAQSVILPGCHLSEGAVVGALSLVTKPLAGWSIYHGNPARRVSERSREVLDLGRVMKARLSAFDVEQLTA